MRRPVGSDVRSDARWAGFAVLTVLLALGLLQVGDHRYFWYGDTPAAYYGWWYHLGELVRQGGWTTLDPHAWRAGNLAAEGQWGIWSPLTIGIGLLATVVSNMLLLTVVVKLGFAAAAVLGIYLLARSYGVPPGSAYIAGVLAPMGGMTQYLDLPSWAAAEMIWALFPWVWWGLRRVMLRGASPLPPLVAGYLLVTVGYVFGTIMLIVAIVACLLDCCLTRNRPGALRVLLAGLLLGLVAVTVYLPAVLTAPVTARETGYGGFGGKFTTDPLTLIAGVLPTDAFSTGTDHLLPYPYVAWLLPAILWIDWRRAARGWRSLGGLLVFVVATVAMVCGPGQIDALRWPLRLQPFLVEGAVVLLVVAWSRFGSVRPSAVRLTISLAWVASAGIVALARASSVWRAHVCALVVVSGGLVLIWWLIRRGRTAWLAPAAGAVTLAAFGVQHGFFASPPSPQRNAPTDVSAYAGLYPGALGDVLQVGATDDMVRADPRAARQLPIGSAWYLTGLHSQNTYTAISHAAYKARYCIYYEGDTCPELLGTLFSTEPTTGQERVDLLGVSSLLLVRADYPARTLASPPAGWTVAGRTAYSVMWTRRTPVPGAGSVAWASPGTSVSGVHTGATSTTFRVDRVPPDGGTIVLRLLDWPGYSASAGSIADPLDGYLLTLHVPPSVRGQSLEVSFHPPGWRLELGAWLLALAGGAAWSVVAAVRRRRRHPASTYSTRIGVRRIIATVRGGRER